MTANADLARSPEVEHVALEQFARFADLVDIVGSEGQAWKTFGR